MQQQFKFELLFYYYKAARDKDISILVAVILLNTRSDVSILVAVILLSTRSDIGHNFEIGSHT